MKIRCLVVDDERLALEVMEGYIERVPFLHLEKLCSTPLQALDFLSRNAVDVIFLDIEMPGLSGLQFLQTLRNPPAVILTTAYPQFAVDAFELNATDYLLKPIPFQRFLTAVQKVQSKQLDQATSIATAEQGVKPSEGHIFTKSGTKTVRIDLAEILFIEGKKDHVLIHTKARNISTQVSLSGLLEKLPAEQFLRVHRSFIIALAKIETIERNRIVIDKTEIPVGDFYRDALTKRIGLY
ncbi:two component transcriptional regulator, LytTR family [Dyadobacter soli]|uniref:Two component transcriptional regulator, LytTR family n=1 Tax=Dyadobacter soli TaxID=659014 RepID=A0A1G7EAI0_9BACT|nr:LytTR family DNA-binding domain-containing protein [Dyadobacter soli]SDE60600.1 two component transcriptional regulator, LytTR family [Dyadobacter soli]